VLVSPKFIFRVEADPVGATPGSPFRVSDVELASRLSFFLWSSIPDDELLDVASRGQLGKPAVLEAQVRRMLADPRASALVANFAGQWLHIRNLRSTTPDKNDFPDFDDNLRQAFERELNLFVGSIITEDRSVLDLMTADYTFVNERLAKHYRIPNVYGPDFRRVTLADDARRGLPIDASGQLMDGSKIDGVVGLRESLLKHPDLLVGTMTEKLLTYALGRSLEPADMPAVRGIVRASAKDSYRFSSIVRGIVSSVPFQMRRAREES
jgi:hypothetical protein